MCVKFIYLLKDFSMEKLHHDYFKRGNYKVTEHKNFNTEVFHPLIANILFNTYT